MQMKRCGYCHQMLPLVEFNQRHSSPDGHQYRCRNCQRTWYVIHQKEKLAYNRVYHVAHHEEERAYNKAYYAAHRKEKATYYVTHRKERKVHDRAYYATHREAVEVRHAARRARKRNATIGDSKALYRACHSIHTMPSLRCYWCNCSVPIGERHVDHVIPLAKGGAHASWNLCCSCIDCNLRKHAKLPSEFVGQGELAFA